MSTNKFKLKRNKKQEKKTYNEEISCLKKRISDLESVTMPLQPIGFSVAQFYCIDCGHIMHYNFYKPFTAPSKCSKCNGRMTDKQTEDIFKTLEHHLKKAKPKIEKIKSKKKKHIKKKSVV